MSKASPPVGQVRTVHTNSHTVALVSPEGSVLLACTVKGLLKKAGTEVLVGDRVALDNVDTINQTARIVAVHPRTNSLQRPKVANVDQVLIVHPLREPDFDPWQLDRYLAHAALAGLAPLICLSKSDLCADPGEIERITTLYAKQLGFSVLLTSIRNPDTLAPLVAAAQGKVSVLAGVSGAGKTSLLNALNPHLTLRVGDVSGKLGRGQHTTRHAELVEVLSGVDIVDTPGFSNLKFDTVLPQAVAGVFPEFVPFRGQCAFDDCLHLGGEDCAVQRALQQQPGVFAATRLESYRAMLEEALAYKEKLLNTSQKDEYGSKTLHGKGQEPLRILRLKEKARQASRRTTRQQALEEDGETDGS